MNTGVLRSLVRSIWLQTIPVVLTALLDVAVLQKAFPALPAGMIEALVLVLTSIIRAYAPNLFGPREAAVTVSVDDVASYNSAIEGEKD